MRPSRSICGPPGRRRRSRAGRKPEPGSPCNAGVGQTNRAGFRLERTRSRPNSGHCKPPPAGTDLAARIGLAEHGNGFVTGSGRMGATMRDPLNVQDYSESELTVGQQKEHAAGVKAVAVSMQRSLGQMGAKRSAQTLLKLNQAEGFDCMSCAWP